MRSHELLVLCDTVGISGGTERYLGRLLPALQALGIRVSIAARRVEQADAFGIDAVEQLDWSDEHSAPSARAAAEVRRLMDRRRPAVVLTSNVFDAGILRLARTRPRWIARVHDHRPFCPNGDRVFPQFPGRCAARAGRACVVNALLRGCVCGPRPESLARVRRRLLVGEALARADAVVASGAFMGRECERHGIAQKRIEILPPPLPPEAYAAGVGAMPAAAVLFAGRAVPQKGLLSLVRAIALIARERRPLLRIASERNPHAELALAEAERLRVTADHVGFLDEAALRAQIDRSSVVALPSLWDEPFGLVGIEAQARGRPAVAYAVGGIPEWIGGAGIRVRPGDERALARAIEALAAEQVWRRYAEGAFGRARGYALSRIARRFFEICFPGVAPGAVLAERTA